MAFCPRFSETRSAGEDAGSGRRAAEDGVEGDDFWKNPRMDFWLFMFCALEVVFLSGPDGGVAVVGEDAAGVPLAMAEDQIG